MIYTICDLCKTHIPAGQPSYRVTFRPSEGKSSALGPVFPDHDHVCRECVGRIYKPINNEFPFKISL